ncbi:hypothetical protein ACFE04_021835 [Oxalis oulophora]
MDLTDKRNIVLNMKYNHPNNSKCDCGNGSRVVIRTTYDRPNLGRRYYACGDLYELLPLQSSPNNHHSVTAAIIISVDQASLFQSIDWVSQLKAPSTDYARWTTECTWWCGCAQLWLLMPLIFNLNTRNSSRSLLLVFPIPPIARNSDMIFLITVVNHRYS